MGESVINIPIHDVNDRCLKAPLCVRAAEEPDELFEFAVNHGVQQCFAAGKVVVNGHGGDADLFGDAAHAHGLRPLGLKNAKGTLVNLLRSFVLLVHLYTVYHISYTAYICRIWGPLETGSSLSAPPEDVLHAPHPFARLDKR